MLRNIYHSNIEIEMRLSNPIFSSQTAVVCYTSKSGKRILSTNTDR